MKKQKTETTEPRAEGIVLRGFIYKVHFVSYFPEDTDYGGTYILAQSMEEALGKLKTVFPRRPIAMLHQEDRGFTDPPRMSRLIP